MKDRVIPMKHICRDCFPSANCVECKWYAKLLEQECRKGKED